MREEEHTSEKSGNVLMNLPKEMKGILPENFDFKEIGTIDLNEAEKIANENVLFLTEKDIIEELDEFDLIPLKDEIVKPSGASEKKNDFLEDDFNKLLREISQAGKADFPAKEPGPVQETVDYVKETPEEIRKDHEKDDTVVRGETVSAPTSEKHEASGEPAHIENESAQHDLTDDGIKWVPLELPKEPHSQKDDHGSDNLKWISLEQLDIPAKVLPGDEAIDRVAEKEKPHEQAVRIESPAHERKVNEEIKTPDVAIVSPARKESDKTIATEPPGDTGIKQKETTPTGEGISAPQTMERKEAARETEHAAPQKVKEEELSEDDDDVIWMNFASQNEPRSQLKKEALSAVRESVRGRIQREVEESGAQNAALAERQKGKASNISSLKSEAGAAKREFSIVKEILPDEFLKMGKQDGSVFFIDDRVVEKNLTENPHIFEENELDRITSEMVVIDEGKGFLLTESTVSEDRAAIVQSASAFIREQDEVLYEFEEHRYRDDELDFIHSAIIEDDYIKYIREIDEFSVGHRTDKITTAVEILGITRDEMEDIQETLFGKEYADVNLYDIFDFFSLETGVRDKAGRSEKDCQYFVPADDSLLLEEKNSIEDDIYSVNAFIYEEDVDEIKRLLVLKGGAIPDKSALAARVEPEIGKMEETAVLPSESTVTEEPRVDVKDQIDDITDKVLILEDELDVERFVKDFPPAKQKDIKTLLKYLDGLFERLPENIIKRFASSEYFDLYLKILNELGV